jgi:regulatory protein
MAFRARTEATVLRDGTVTALVAGKGQGERVAVHLDGRRAFDLAVTVADRAGLRAGATLTAMQQQALIEEDAPYRARERAVRLLGLRDRSRREIDARLRQAGFAPEVVAATLDWLAGLGYVDDGRFARTYAAEKQRSGWGPRRIRSELAAKGVERSIVEEVVAPWERPESEAALEPEGGDDGPPPAGAETDRRGGGVPAAEAMARRRFGGQFRTDPAAAERRLAGFLARRGYGWETIARVARTLREEAGAQEGEGVGSEDAGEDWPGP